MKLCTAFLPMHGHRALIYTSYCNCGKIKCLPFCNRPGIWCSVGEAQACSSRAAHLCNPSRQVTASITGRWSRRPTKPGGPQSPDESCSDGQALAAQLSLGHGGQAPRPAEPSPSKPDTRAGRRRRRACALLGSSRYTARPGPPRAPAPPRPGRVCGSAGVSRARWGCCRPGCPRPLAPRSP